MLPPPTTSRPPAGQASVVCVRLAVSVLFFVLCLLAAEAIVAL